MGVTRKTKTVKELLTVFENIENALSVVDLVKQLANKMNKTTVYRILERLESDGHLHSFIGRDGLKWYAKCNECSSVHHNDVHPHFQCSDCGKSECIDLDVSIPKISNRKIDNIELLLVGQCEECCSN